MFSPPLPQPRPMNGIVVAVIVMNWTFASSGSPAMNATASARALRVERRLGHDRPVRLRRPRRDPLGHLGVRVPDVDLTAGDVVRPAVEGDRLGQTGNRVPWSPCSPRNLGGARCAEIDPLLMIRPPLRVLRLHHPPPRDARTGKRPVRLVATIDCHPSGVSSSTAAPAAPPVPRVCSRAGPPGRTAPPPSRTARRPTPPSPTSAATGSTVSARARSAVSAKPGEPPAPPRPTCHPWPASVTVISPSQPRARSGNNRHSFDPS